MPFYVLIRSGPRSVSPEASPDVVGPTTQYAILRLEGTYPTRAAAEADVHGSCEVEQRWTVIEGTDFDSAAANWMARLNQHIRANGGFDPEFDWRQ